MTTAAATILVVDDDAENRRLIARFLESARYRVLEAVSGEQALALAAQTPPALVLLDVMLPGLSGFEVCERLKQDPQTSGAAVIMVTALDDAESRTRAFESDADEFLAKPVFRPELLARVRASLHARQMRLDKEAALLALEAEKRDRLQALFERYMSKTVAQHLLQLPDAERAALLSHQRRVECAVMFTDMRGFTAMADALAPDAVVGILNEHFNSLTEIAHAHAGTIFNMTGDGLLVGFGVPIAQADPCGAALRAARAMQRDFLALRDKVRRLHGLEIGLGIGVNYGPVIMGNVGSDRFLAFTIIGDTVNVAARVQALAEAGAIVVTDAVRRAAPGLVGPDSRALEGVTLKGKARDQVLYRLAAA